MTQAIDEGTRRRLTGTLFVTQSLFAAASIAAFTLMPILAKNLSGSDALAGIPSTLTLLGRAAAAYPLGWLMDKAGRRLGLSIGFGLGFVGSAVAVLAIVSGSFWGFGLGVMLMGMGRSSSDQTRYVAAEIQPLHRRAKIIGLIVFASTVGAVGGPLIVDPAVALAARLGWAGDIGPYVVGAGLYLLAWLLTVLLLRPDPLLVGWRDDPAEGEAVVEVVQRPLTTIFANRTVQLAVAAMVVGQLVMTLIMVITPLHMDYQAHSTRAISLVIMAHTLGMFGLSGVTGWLIDRYGRVAMIVAGAAVLVVSAVMTPLVESVFMLGVALFLLGLGWNFCYIAGSSLLSDALRQAERGRAQGAAEVLVALASGTGSASTGSVFAFGGITAVSAVGLAITLALVALLAWSRWQRWPVSGASAAGD